MRPSTTDTQLPSLKVSDTASKRLLTPAAAHTDQKDTQALLKAQEAVLDVQARPYGESSTSLNATVAVSLDSQPGLFPEPPRPSAPTTTKP